MRIGSIKRTARESLKGKWGFAILTVIIGFGIYNFVPMFFEVILSGGFSNWAMNDTTSPVISFVSFILSFLLFPITIGVYWGFLNMVRGMEATIEDVFKLVVNLGLYLKSIGLFLLVGVYTILWSLLFIIPGIIKAIAYSQVYYILKEHPDYSLNEIITASRKLMDGNKWKFFLLQLSFIGWGILCIFTLGIGLLWLIPYFIASMAAFYNEISNQLDDYE